MNNIQWIYNIHIVKLRIFFLLPFFPTYYVQRWWNKLIMSVYLQCKTYVLKQHQNQYQAYNKYLHYNHPLHTYKVSN